LYAASSRFHRGLIAHFLVEVRHFTRNHRQAKSKPKGTVRRMKGWSLIVALFCVCQCALTQQPDGSELEKIIVAELRETNAPGASLVIPRGTQVIYAKGFGTANVETNAPVTPDAVSYRLDNKDAHRRFRQEVGLGRNTSE
jgi:hypothetical protein